MNEVERNEQGKRVYNVDAAVERNIVMDKKTCFENYRKYREVYEKYFQEDANVYWEMYRKHLQEGVTYEKLGYEYGYSQSTLRRIFRRIEDVLGNPERYVLEDSPKVELSKGVLFPNAFLDAKYRLSSTALWESESKNHLCNPLLKIDKTVDNV